MNALSHRIAVIIHLFLGVGALVRPTSPFVFADIVKVFLTPKLQSLPFANASKLLNIALVRRKGLLMCE